MDQYIIKGGNPLVGEVEIGGAKNAALPIISAAIMTDETVTLEVGADRTKLEFQKWAVKTVTKPE